ncbi:MAG: helix-turn-helix domain-containing protein [Acutalibacteraceae bacterium]
MIQNDRKSQVQKIEKFFNQVYPVSEKYEGCRQLWISCNGFFKQVFCCKTSDFYNQLQNFVVNKNCNYYITSNSFYADRRGTEYLFSADNFVFDLDNHNPNISAYDLARKVNRLLSVLDTPKYNDKFPYPTATIITGRGVQLWVHIESISSKLLFLWKLTANNFCDILEQICKEENIDLIVDRTSSCNASGLFRLPFTYNTNSDKYIDEIDVSVHNVSYKIDDLIERFNLVQNSVHSDEKNNNSVSDDDYKPLHFKRIKYIEDYVKFHNFDVVGHRNAIIFLYYNACVQVMERSSALELTEKLNKSFKNQYSESEFKTVVAAVDKHIYKFTNKTFFEILGLSEEEQERYREMSTYKPKIDKAERNKKIFQLAIQRKTCQQIADEVGCSIRTVKTVLKNFDKSEFLAIQVRNLYANGDKTQQEIADIFNISVRQVKRYLKNGVSKSAKIL